MVGLPQMESYHLVYQFMLFKLVLQCLVTCILVPKWISMIT